MLTEKLHNFLSPTLQKVPEHVKWFRLQFRNLLRLCALIILREAPKCFDFTPSLAIHHMAWHPYVHAIAQLVQNALGQSGLGLIHHDSRTRQKDRGQSWFAVHNCPWDFRADVKTTYSDLIVENQRLISRLYDWQSTENIKGIVDHSRKYAHLLYCHKLDKLINTTHFLICTVSLKLQPGQGISFA